MVDKELIVTTGTIKIDFVTTGMRPGFSIRSQNPINKGNSCSSGSCGTSCG